MVISEHQQKLRRRASTIRHQQTGDSFDYSNTDLRDIISIGRDARTIIITRKKEYEEAEAYSPTSNFRLPDNCECNSRKRRHISPILSPPTKQLKIDAIHRRLHAKCFLHPKVKHSSFQCINLHRALGAPPPPADEGASA